MRIETEQYCKSVFYVVANIEYLELNNSRLLNSNNVFLNFDHRYYTWSEN